MPLFNPVRQTLLGFSRTVNFNTTGDTAISMLSVRYAVRRIVVDNASISLNVATGGFYTAAAKGGTTLVANTQVYSALTAAAKFVDCTLLAILTTDYRTETQLFFSLTNAQGAAATADIWIFGDDLS